MAGDRDKKNKNVESESEPNINKLALQHWSRRNDGWTNQCFGRRKFGAFLGFPVPLNLFSMRIVHLRWKNMKY